MKYILWTIILLFGHIAISQDLSFTNVSEEAGLDYTHSFSITAPPMTFIIGGGSATGDIDNDGYLDLFFTLGDEQNGVMMHNNGDGTFTNVASENGTIFESVAWGSVFLDAENDTDLDLYVSGELDGETSFLPSAFYENDGMGNFSIPFAAGFDNDTARSFSNAMGDINNDGYPDIIVLNYEPHDIFIWKNQSSQNNNWIKIKLEGVESNKQGIGSWIEISVNGNKQYNYTLCGEGYLGQNSAYEFFGIGESSVIDYIKVTWLSGNVDIITNPMINSHTTIIEGENLDLNNIENPIIRETLKYFGIHGAIEFLSFSDVPSRTGLGGSSSYCVGMSHLLRTFLNKKISKVAVLGGSGSFCINAAIAQGADALVTADLKYHDFYVPENGLLLVDAGHYETEHFTKKIIQDFLTKKILNFAIILSEENTNPVKYL